MKIEQLQYTKTAFEKSSNSTAITNNGHTLVLGFGAKKLLEQDDIYDKLKTLYPNSNIVLCSTSGEIYDTAVADDTVSAVAMEFEKTPVKTIQINIANYENSFAAGQSLFKLLPQQNLSYVLVISDGGLVNGSELVRGIDVENINDIPVTGGLAGDAANFNYTVVGHNQNPEKGNIVAIGFYGSNIKISHGSLGGWEKFGPEKKVTKSVSNVLYEMDNKNALETYKLYLGKYADELPGSALLFPLAVRLDETENYVVRTILNIDATQSSMTFAGDIPVGAHVRFMKANFDKLIDASAHAATAALSTAIKQKPQLALLISCVGRKLILSNRIDEEIEAIREIFGPATLLTGFYSYGEISPLVTGSKCELHNQTMTITTFDETC